MAIIKRGNFSFSDPGDKVPDASTIEGGNFSQLEPDTAIMVGKTLTINGGNFVNVRRDANWIIKGGNWCQVERCSHLHPEWVERGLSECAENCGHVTEIDTVEGEGGQSITVYQYADTVQ